MPIMLTLPQKTAAVIATCILTFPITLLLVISAYIRRLISNESEHLQAAVGDRITVLVNNGALNKSLDVARAMHRGGHRVILVEIETHTPWIAARFSNAVSRFYRVPDPLVDYNGYQRTMTDICTKEKVKLFIPVSAVQSAYHDALLGSYLQQFGVDTLAFGSDLTRDLDDKWSFNQKVFKPKRPYLSIKLQCGELNLKVPATFLIRTKDDLMEFDFTDHEGKVFILKRSNGESPPDRRLVVLDYKMSEKEIAEAVRNIPIEPRNPYVLQEFVRGMEVATYTIAVKGEVRAFCCTPSTSITTKYIEVEVPAALEFTKKIVSELQLTGHICFDFIIPETQPHEVLPLECNPRCHTAICLFAGHPWLAEAYYPTKRSLQTSLNDEEYFSGCVKGPPLFPLRPMAGNKPVYWIGHALYDVLLKSRDTLKFINLLLKGRDGFFTWSDPLPFMAMYHLQFPLEVFSRFQQRIDWSEWNEGPQTHILQTELI